MAGDEKHKNRVSKPNTSNNIQFLYLFKEKLIGDIIIMPQHSFIGTKTGGKNTDKYDDYFETKVKFELIANSPKIDGMETSDSQRQMDEDKIGSMVEEFHNHPQYLNCKNTIVIGVFRDKWYLVDGQHRLEMAKRVYRETRESGVFVFCWYTCNTEDDMRQLFISVNKDSVGNEFYVKSDHMMQIMIDEFVNKLRTHYPKKFSPRTINKHTYTIPEFRNELIKNDYFCGFTNAQDVFESLIEKNRLFFEKNRYQVDIDHKALDCYYKDDIKKIEAGFIMGVKRCNFVEWLTDETVEPYHSKKTPKHKISPHQRKLVWGNANGNMDTCQCPITGCQHVLRRDGKGGWHSGHIISERNGGGIEISNMKPICGTCNQSMGAKNWADFDPDSL
jgi:hypothetical protein